MVSLDQGNRSRGTPAERSEAALAALLTRDPRPLRCPGDVLPMREELHERSSSGP